MSAARLSLLLALCAIAPGARAGIRQRHFQSAPDEAGHYGQESIIHWAPGTDIDITYHDFAGTMGRNSGGAIGNTTTTFTATDFAGMILAAKNQWLGIWSALGPNFLADLSATITPTSDACEFLPSGELGGHNVLLTTKMDTDCGDALGASGIVGLTGVLYYLSNGEIAEADIQFNDLHYKFVDSGPNVTTGAKPYTINLRDVLTHEFGHFFGLDHSASRVSTMLFSVANGQETPAPLDMTALYSLYPPDDGDDEMGSVQGSVTRGSKPIFGAFLTFLDARTLQSVATEMSDLNGGFEACRVPSGPHLVFARSYKPAQQLSHFYYSGNGSELSDEKDSNGNCLNPGCKILDQDTVVSFHGSTGDAGFEPHVFNVEAGESIGFVNLVASTSVTQPTDVGGTDDTAAELRLDTPLLEWIGAGFSGNSDDALELFNPDFSADSDYYEIVVPTDTDDFSVRTAALSIYSRLALVIDVVDQNDDPIANCTPITSSYMFNGTSGATLDAGFDARTDSLDPGVDCVDVAESVVYVRVRGDYLPCSSLPGTGSSCNGAALTVPLYLISAYDPADLAQRVEVAAGAGLSVSSDGGSKYTNMPTCSAFSTTVGGGPKTATEESACCGTLRSGGPGGPDAFLSFLLALLLSPLTWFASWWFFCSPARGRNPRSGQNARAF
jgi:hypothetical protein